MFPVPAGRGIFVFLLGDGGFLLPGDLPELLLHCRHVRCFRHIHDTCARAGFVHDINGFVRQETSADITVRQLDCGDNRLGV